MQNTPIIQLDKMKLAQIKANKVIAFFDEEDELPDNSHFVNVDDKPEVQIGWSYINGQFSSQTMQSRATAQRAD